MKGLFYQHGYLVEAISLCDIEYLSFYKLWVKRGKSQRHWASVTLSLLVPEAWILRFRRINSGVFGQGVCRVSTNFVN